MKHLYSASFVLAIALGGTPAWGHDGQWYMQASAGSANDSTYTFHLPDESGNGQPIDLFRLGVSPNTVLSGAIGYDLGKVRLEGEISSSNSRVDAFTDPSGVSNLTPSSSFLSRSSRVSFMTNAMLDIGNDNSAQFYIGAGAGIVRTHLLVSDTDRVGNVVVTTAIDDSSDSFAWQGFAGVRYPIARNFDIGLKYRYLRQSGFNARLDESCDLSSSSSQIYSSPNGTHAVMVTLGYNLGRN